MSADEPVIVARIVRAHGIRGGLLFQSETDHAEALFQPGQRLRVVEAGGSAGAGSAGAGPAGSPPPTRLTIRSARPHAGRWLVTTDEVADRTAAETLRGRGLSVLRSELPELEGDGYLLHDLVGLTVVEGETPLGKIHEVYDQPGAPLLALMIEGRERLIPFQEDLVEALDLEAGEIVVRLPAGLLDI